MRDGSRNAPRVIRCAIYTRKSSEEGLEQAFNSLHAQREACEAYVLSQRHEGWNVIPTAFDDGGFSGGTMERPALRALLEEIRAGRVDVVVVYKIDRLTRSLFDFAKIVEILDTANASFVSVTQSFNTTTSMGRLTLNVLLSFAQFEREVTGERIRDKIAASKRKGMWMGGNVPFGYDLKDRTLIPNDPEAPSVRTIFEAYDRLGTVRAMKAVIDRQGLRTRIRTTRRSDGTTTVTGGKCFGIGHLYWILRNPVYAGCIRHKDKVFEGGHQGLIDNDLWQRVQERLTQQAVERKSGSSKGKSPSLLTGRIFAIDGRRLTPSHTVKGARHYRYYATVGVPEGEDHKRVGSTTKRSVVTASTGNAAPQTPKSNQLRLSASDLERTVAAAVSSWLSNPSATLDWLSQAGETPSALGDVLERTAMLGDAIRQARSPSDLISSLRPLIGRLKVGEDQIRIGMDTAALVARLGIEQDEERPLPDPVIEQSYAVRRRGRDRKLVISSAANDRDPDKTLIAAIARARHWFASLKDRKAGSIADLAEKTTVNRSWISSQLPLAFLAPDLVAAVVDGNHAPALTLDRLIVIASASPDWVVQRRKFNAV